MIKKGNKVKVLTGKDRNKEGEIIEIDRPLNRAKVKGINIVKKHVRPNPQEGVQGGIEEKEMPLNLSNVAIYNATTQKADRVGIRVNDKGEKERFFKSSGETVL